MQYRFITSVDASEKCGTAKPPSPRQCIMKKTFAIYLRRHLEMADNLRVWKVTPEKVRVMAVAEKYAMVRHKAAMPFCVALKDLVTDVHLTAATPEGAAPQ